MNLPEWMIHQSFRYCLGRRTYAVSAFTDWAIKNINDIPLPELRIIERELGEAIERDIAEQHLDCGRSLGDACDVAKWYELFDALSEFREVAK